MRPIERMTAVFEGRKPDRVPVMCQMAMGYMYRNLDMDPVRFWYTSEGLADAYVELADRYRFDGILVNKTGRDPALAEVVLRVEGDGQGHRIIRRDGTVIYAPPDEYPRVQGTREEKQEKSIGDLDPAKLRAECSQPLPAYYLDVLKRVREKRAGLLSIHGEVGSTFERFLCQLGSYEAGLMALVDDPDKCLQCMSIINERVIREALVQCGEGVDAMKISSPFAGAGFISRAGYETFVLPFERALIAKIKESASVPCYLHTCGAIGDRLDLMVESGTDGIECLDPPPLGTVDLREAVEAVGDRIWIKGNLDSVHELSNHSPSEVKEIARKRLEIGKQGKGYILSTACSIAPVVPEENVLALAEVVEEFGRY